MQMNPCGPFQCELLGVYQIDTYSVLNHKQQLVTPP